MGTPSIGSHEYYGRGDFNYVLYLHHDDHDAAYHDDRSARDHHNRATSCQAANRWFARAVPRQAH